MPATNESQVLSARELREIHKSLKTRGGVRRDSTRSRVLGNLMPRRLGFNAVTSHRWLDFLPGIRCRVLRAREDGMVSMLWRVAPGAGLPAHDHEQADECLVLRGQIQVGNETLGRGDFLVGRQGERHPDIVAPNGALVYIHAHVPHLAMALRCDAD